MFTLTDIIKIDQELVYLWIVTGKQAKPKLIASKISQKTNNTCY